jgi:hypothetical protein
MSDKEPCGTTRGLAEDAGTDISSCLSFGLRKPSYPLRLPSTFTLPYSSYSLCDRLPCRNTETISPTRELPLIPRAPAYASLDADDHTCACAYVYPARDLLKLSAAATRYLPSLNHVHATKGHDDAPKERQYGVPDCS